MSSFIPFPNLIFDEDKFLSGCMSCFAKIRDRYNLDKERLELTRRNLGLKSLVDEILDGYTEEGIMRLAKKDPFFPELIMLTMPWVVDSTLFNKTDYWLNTMMQKYEEKCKLLCQREGWI